MSKLFGRTLREVPSGTEVAGHGLLLRAGFVRRLAAGVFSYLPLAKRSIDKVQAILREEVDGCGGQEVSMPVVQPAEVWERSGRYVGTWLYGELRSAGVEVLYDDRRETLGTKFKDADLIGVPIRLTLTPRSLRNGGAEIKLRWEPESRIVPVERAAPTVRETILGLESETREARPRRLRRRGA